MPGPCSAACGVARERQSAIGAHAGEVSSVTAPEAAIRNPLAGFTDVSDRVEIEAQRQVPPAIGLSIAAEQGVRTRDPFDIHFLDHSFRALRAGRQPSITQDGTQRV